MPSAPPVPPSPSVVPFVPLVVLLLDPPRVACWSSVAALLLAPLFGAASPAVAPRGHPLGIDWDPVTSQVLQIDVANPALDDRSFLPAQVGAIVGAYAVAVALVGVAVLVLSKHRRHRILAAQQELAWPPPVKATTPGRPAGFDASLAPIGYPGPAALPGSSSAPLRQQLPPLDTGVVLDTGVAFGIVGADVKAKSPLSPTVTVTAGSSRSLLQGASSRDFGSSDQLYVSPSIGSSSHILGIDPSVDPAVVQQDRKMAQEQLEMMYKYVMEHEEAREAGIKLEAPPSPLAAPGSDVYTRANNPMVAPPAELTEKQKKKKEKKEKGKPSNLNLSGGKLKDEKWQSRVPSMLSAILSPRKSRQQIEPPLMTPISSRFPGDGPLSAQPFHYRRVDSREPHPLLSSAGAAAPARAAPPSPVAELGPGAEGNEYDDDDDDEYAARTPRESPPALTPDQGSPREPIGSLDARLGGGAPRADADKGAGSPVGLPSSPRPGSTFSSGLPASPRPGATFPGGDSPLSPTTTVGPSPATAGPTAVRQGGALPLRAYETPLSSPRFGGPQTKQTVLTRIRDHGVMSPHGGVHTPYTGVPVPYSPYQPNTPCVPMTPSLVTKADRKRMKKMEPKTPTMEMVQNESEVW